MLMMKDFCKNKAVNLKLKQFVNDRLLLLIAEDFTPFGGEYRVVPTSKNFSDYASMYFPLKYPHAKTGILFYDLYKLLQEEEERRPKLIQDYVMCRLIEAEIERRQLSRVDTVELMENREGLLQVLKKEKRAGAEKLLAGVEDLMNYPSLLYEDTDFSLLEHFEAVPGRRGFDFAFAADKII